MTAALPALPARLSAKITPEPCPVIGLDPWCWIWTGAHTSKSYGSASHEGRVWSAHKLAYTLLIGPVPDGLQLDHLCRCKSCCNPAHLEPVTARMNLLRAVRKESCVRGHEYTPENTIPKKGGSQRNCRTCANEWQRNNRQKAANAITGAQQASA